MRREGLDFDSRDACKSCFGDWEEFVPRFAKVDLEIS